MVAEGGIALQEGDPSTPWVLVVCPIPAETSELEVRALFVTQRGLLQLEYLRDPVSGVPPLTRLLSSAPSPMPTAALNHISPPSVWETGQGYGATALRR